MVVDTPARTREWFAVADDLTGEAGLVTSENVPVARLTYERNLLTAARLEFEPNEPGGTK